MDKDMQIMKESIETAGEYIVKLIEGIGTITSNFQGGREDRALEMCTDLIDGLNWLSDVFSLTAPLQEKYGCHIKADASRDVFLQLIEAFENRDYVLLGDLLEYELLPVASDWRKQLGTLLDKMGVENASNS